MRNWKLWVGLVFSILFIWLAFRKVDWEGLRNSLTTANYFYLLPIIALTILTYVIRAWRWKYLLLRIKEIRVYNLFVVTIIGFMANNILPARLGEFVKAYALARKEDLGTSLSLATIVMERIFDVFFLLIYAVLILPMLRSQEWLLYLLLLINVVSLTAVILLKLKTPLLLRLIRSLLSRFPAKWVDRVVGVVDSFSSGLRVLGSWKDVVIASILSLALWGTVVITIYLAFIAFDMDLPVLAAVVVMVILMLGKALPSSPGFVGTFQFFASIGLIEIFSVPKDLALSFSIVYHAAQYLPITALGLFYLWREGWSFSDISRRTQEVERGRKIT